MRSLTIPMQPMWGLFGLAGLLLLLNSAAAETSIALFNGRDLDGFQVVGCEAGVEEGNLVIQGGNGFVRTDHQYRDFVFQWQWRARRAANFDSGVFFRAALPTDNRPWPEVYEIDLKAGEEGCLIGFPTARSNGLARSGDWNHCRLTARGSRVALEMNGSQAWSIDGLEPRAGYIALQVKVPSGGQFEFRELAVIELGYRSLFNERDLEGWQGGSGRSASDCWRVEDGLLMCTGERGPWLRSLDRFDDFNLRLEYRLKPGGNSGVYLRVAEDGAHRDPGEGVEIQILDDNSPRYADLNPYQYTGSVYAIAAPEQRVGRAVGNWNSLEIDCRGHSYRVVHNGVLVVAADPNRFPALLERRLEGFLGLQNHSEEVWYRRLRVGPPLESGSTLSQEQEQEQEGGAAG